MTELSDLQTTSQEAASMRARLDGYVKAGVTRQTELLQVITSRMVTNRLPLPDSLRVRLTATKGQLLLVAESKDEPKQCFSAPLHRNALQQLCSNPPDIKVSMRDIRWFLEGEVSRQMIVPFIFNTLFANEHFLTGGGAKRKGRIKRFLVRLVKEGGSDKEEVRAFLSDKFGVTYDTKQLLRAFVESCGRIGAGPVAAYHDDLRTSLTCCLPYVFEPVDKSFIALGVNFTNSDFGRGALAISTVAFSLRSGTSAILEHEYSKRHIGTVLSCTELESSAEFKRAEINAQAQAVRDLVPRALSLEATQNTLELIQWAHEHRMQWYEVDKFLTSAAALRKEERDRLRQLLAGPPMGELPSPSVDQDGDWQANAWWLANAIGWLGANELEEKRHDLELAAGKLLGKVTENR